MHGDGLDECELLYPDYDDAAVCCWIDVVSRSIILLHSYLSANAITYVPDNAFIQLTALQTLLAIQYNTYYNKHYQNNTITLGALTRISSDIFQRAHSPA